MLPLRLIWDFLRWHQQTVSWMERDAHNDLKKRPTPQKHDDIFVFPYVGSAIIEYEFVILRNICGC